MLIRFIDDPSDGREALGQWCEERYKSVDSWRQRIEYIWARNILWLAGNQDRAVAQDFRRFGHYALDELSTKIKTTSNHILPMCRQGVAAVAGNISRMVAIPATDDPADVAAAELCTDVTEAAFYEDNEAEMRRNETMWAIVACCMRWNYWDPDRDGVGIMGKMAKVGEAATATLNPWRFHLAPWTAWDEKPPFIIISDIKSIEEINDVYKPIKAVKAEEVADAARHLDSMLNSVVTGSEMSSGATPKRNGAAILKRMYCEPTRQYPQGRTLTFANGIVCKDTTLPEDQMPGVKLGWFPIPGSAYPLPMVSPLIDPQHVINTTVRQAIDMNNRNMRKDVLTAGSGDITWDWQQEAVAWDPDTGIPTKFRRSPAKHIKLGPGVTQFQVLDYNAHLSEMETMIIRQLNDMVDAAGVHDPTSGKTSPAGTTLGEIQTLVGADAQGFSLIRNGFDMAHARVTLQKLDIRRNHYDIPRIARTVGRNDQVKIRAFFGADLRNTSDIRPRPMPIVSEAEELRIRAMLGTAGAWDLSGSAQAKLNKIEVLLGSGLPDASQQVENLLGGMSVDHLRTICAAINANEIKASLVQSNSLVAAVEAQAAAQDAAIAAAQEQPSPSGQGQEQATPASPLQQIMAAAQGAAGGPQQGQPVGQG